MKKWVVYVVCLAVILLVAFVATKFDSDITTATVWDKDHNPELYPEENNNTNSPLPSITSSTAVENS